jgi:hypothetical protein
VNTISRLSNIVLGILLLAASFPAVASSAAVPAGKAPPPRYPYCNVYTVTACFGISAGDELRMTMPVDFTLYDLRLAHSVKARIYLGYNPETDAFVSAKPCEPRGDASQCGYVTSASTWDVLYQGVGNQPAIHIHIEGSGVDARQVVHDFLGNFRPCVESGSGLRCKEDRIFRRID